MPRPKQKNTHNKQRLRLIDACLSALHIYGPSRTTVEKVVAIAKLSPGIVRFYFASKAAMLVASLQYLAAEFEDQLLAPVSRLKDKPVAALQLLVELYLDPELASPRKVSVWYAFWGEASSRQEYYDICGQKDEGFAALVREIIERLIVKSGLAHLDADAIALGLIGVLEMLWQEIAFKDEDEIDRQAAKARALAYLRSVFPGQFLETGGAAAAADSDALAAWTYDNARLFALERERIFQASWQYGAHVAQLREAGDFVSLDLEFGRLLLLRTPGGEIVAFHNSCPAAPHALVAPGAGTLKSVRCAVHGLEFGLDGRAANGSELLPVDMRTVGEFVLVRAAHPIAGAIALADPWQELRLARGMRPLPRGEDVKVAADWKILTELYLGLAPAGVADQWSSARYAALTQQRAAAIRRVFLPPNQWIELRPDGISLRQILPIAAGRSLLRHYRFSSCDDQALASAAEYLAGRLSGMGRASTVTVAESIQHGVVDLGHKTQARSAAVSLFQRQLKQTLPQLALDQPGDL